MQDFMEDTVSLKIKQTEVPASVLMYLKKKTGSSLSEIKEKIKNKNYLIVLQHYRFKSLKTINQMRRDLMDFNLDVELFEDGALSDPAYFKNLEARYYEEEKELGLLEEWG